MSNYAGVAADEDQAITTKVSDTTTLATGAGVSLFAKMSGRGMFVLGQIILARVLGPALFGIYAIGVNFLSALGLIAPMGLDKGTIHFAARYWRKQDAELKSAIIRPLVLALISGTVLAGFVIVAAPQLGLAFQKPAITPVLRVIIPALPLMACLYVAAAATTITKRMRYTALARDLSQPVVNLLLVVTFLLLGFGLMGAVVATVVSYALATLLALYYVGKLFPEVLRKQPMAGLSTRDLLAFSVPTTLAGVFTNLTNRVDRLLVGFFRPATEVGIYQAVAQSAVLFTTIMGAFNAIFLPLIADLYHENEMDRLNELFKVATKWELYLTLPIFLVILFIPAELISVIFGANYASGAVPLVVLAGAQLVNVATGAVGPLLIMTGHQTKWLRISAMSFSFNVILNLILVPRFGLLGSAVASFLAITLLFVSGLFQVRRTLQLWPYDGRYFKGLAASLATFIWLAILGLVPFEDLLMRSLITVTSSFGVFAAVLLLLGLDAEDRDFIKTLRVRIGR